MAKSVTLNFTDTAGGTAPTLTADAKNYAVDFAQTVNDPGIVDVANITSPTDAKNTERYAVSAIADIYKGTPVTQGYQSPDKSGFSLLSQCNVVATITDSVDTTYRVDVPISAHVVIKGPNESLITVAHLTEILMRAVGGLYETDGSSRISKLVRGALLPSDM